MSFFEIEQAAKQPVVLGVADQRIVKHVISMIVPTDFLPELGDFLCRGMAR
jgi:hypothetical protein